jgi:chromosome segregation ATPase
MKSNKIIRYILILAVIVIVALITSNIQTKNAFSVKSAEYDQQLAALNAQITVLETNLTALSLLEKNDNVAALTKMNNVSNNLSNEIQLLSKSISDVNTKIMQLQKDVAALKPATPAVTTSVTK